MGPLAGRLHVFFSAECGIRIDHRQWGAACNAIKIRGLFQTYRFEGPARLPPEFFDSRLSLRHERNSPTIGGTRPDTARSHEQCSFSRGRNEQQDRRTSNGACFVPHARLPVSNARPRIA